MEPKDCEIAFNYLKQKHNLEDIEKDIEGYLGQLGRCKRDLVLIKASMKESERRFKSFSFDEYGCYVFTNGLLEFCLRKLNDGTYQIGLNIDSEE